MYGTRVRAWHTSAAQLSMGEDHVFYPRAPLLGYYYGWRGLMDRSHTECPLTALRPCPNDRLWLRLWPLAERASIGA